MATIKDVAKRANVAISTVSNVLNNVDVVSPETKKRILEAVEELNYVPNVNGRCLKSTKTGYIGLLVATLAGAFYSDLVNSMYNRCYFHDYGLMIFVSHERNVEQAFYSVLGKRVDGAIVLNSYIDNLHVETLRNHRFPVTFLDREVQGSKMSSVTIDNQTGIRAAMDHLIQRGAKDIMFVHGASNNFDAYERYHTYLKVMRENNFYVDTGRHVQGDFDEGTAFHEMSAFIESGTRLPQAIIAANDQMAIGCIKALLAHNIRVPEDVSVVGFDNIDLCQYIQPNLTTIDNSVKDLAKNAVDSLVAMINGETGIAQKVPTKLIIRDSTL